MRKRNGFTLMELLGTIVILGTVLAVVSIVMVSIIKKTQAKTYEITENNIISTTMLYVKENPTKFNKKTSEGIEYKCISIKELIDSGYYDDNIKESKITYNNETINLNDDMLIYIERDMTTKVYNDGIILKNDKENYAKYCDYLQKIPCPKLKSYDSLYDGKEHTIEIAKIDEDLKLRYRTDVSNNWSETLPVRKEIGTTKVYVEVEDKMNKVKYCELSSITIRK